jgi:hypothetical protein
MWVQQLPLVIIMRRWCTAPTAEEPGDSRFVELFLDGVRSAVLQPILDLQA